MKLKEYIEKFQKLLDENPEYGELTVLRKTDRHWYEELNTIFPEVGHYNDEEFVPEYLFNDMYDDIPDVNAITVN